MRKRLLSLLLVACMVFPCVSYSAKAEDGDKDAVIAAMRSIQPIKDEYGLAAVDFVTLKIGEAVNVYDYIDDTFVFSRIAYPLFSGNELVAILYQVGDSVYQVMNGMDDLINEIECSEIAIVYDCDGCHVFDGEDFHQIYVASDMGVTKDSLTEDAQNVCLDVIELSDYINSSDLGYTDGVMSRTGAYRILDVPYVTQNPYANFCWAASIAAIKNYKSSLSLTAYQVASYYFELKGETLTDSTISIQEVEEHLWRYLPGMTYTLELQVPTDATIVNNINAGNPILGSWDTGGIYHDVVIRGYNTTNSMELFVIDPQVGYMVAYKIGGYYRYTRADNNVTLILARAICNSWD